MKHRFRMTFRAALALLLAATPAWAQQSDNWDPRQAQMTRAELNALLDRLDRAAESEAYSDALRQQSRLQAAQVKERLTDGDFQVGDRILLRVEGEQALSDTFVVSTGRALTLPVFGDVQLTGVLRSELDQRLAAHIGRYVRRPVVHVRSLVRLSITGRVSRPGFYLVPADTPLPDVLMFAGGPGAEAKLSELRVDRGADHLWEGEPLRTAVAEGRTIDQLNLRAGDQILVPGSSAVDLERIARVVGILVTIPAAIFGITRLF